MLFFKPTNEFIDWLIKYAGKRAIVECGSGEGYTLHLLDQKGFKKAVGIDPYEPIVSLKEFPDPEIEEFERPTNILPTYAQSSPLVTTDLKEALIIIPRPDHGGWCEKVIKNAHPVHEILYIGKEENLYQDLPEDTKYKKLKTPALKEEIVLSFKKKLNSRKLGKAALTLNQY